MNTLILRPILTAALAAGVFSGEALAAPPSEPMVLDDIPQVGRPGGSMTMLVSRTKDTRLYHVYGHARLVGYDLDLSYIPDVLANFEVEDDRVFTFTIRDGHKWSDGEPFTSEDFRFFWEDVANNSSLRPTGPPIDMEVEGELPQFEVIDEKTVRFTWSKPNPFFLPAIAAATPLFIYAPAHYLKQFHADYADPAELDRMVEEDQARDWAQLFGRRDRISEFDNPDLPTLQPWMLTTYPPAERFVAKRNPHFHRVDSQGQQLPYIDEFVLQVVDGKLIPIKTGAGETDLQARGISFKDYTFLKENEARSGLDVHLWLQARGAHLALYPNLNAADDVWRNLFRDLRFRKALSFAIDRDGLSQFLYFGLATPANNTVLPGSPLYTDEVGQACLGHDLDTANQLLDELGMDQRANDGIRLLPDGRRAEIIIETAGEDSEQTDVLALVRDDFAKIGIRVHTKPSEREVLRNRVFAGEALMTIWYGNENGLPNALMSPNEFVPTSQFDQLQWPKWGQYFETRGEAGEAPELPEAQRLLELYDVWRTAPDESAKAETWHEILSTYSSQCYTIGLVADVRQPIAVHNGLVNVPEEAVYNWQPHAQLGLYRPDTFWFDN